MRKTTRFHSAPSEMFAGTLTLMTAAALGALALLRVSAGYPGAWLTTGLLFLAALLGATSLWYLAKSRALLRIGVSGIAHVPLGGKAKRYPWTEIGRLRTAPGWLSIHDHDGRRLCCYTYNHAQHATLVRLLDQYRSLSNRPPAASTQAPRSTPARRKSPKPAGGARTPVGRHAPRTAKAAVTPVSATRSRTQRNR